MGERRRVSFAGNGRGQADDTFGYYAAEPVRNAGPKKDVQATYVDNLSPLPERSDVVKQRVETPPKELNNRKGVQLTGVEEVPREEKRIPEVAHRPESVERSTVITKNDFPSSAEEVPEKELAGDSRFIEAEPLDKKRVKPGDFSEGERFLPPIRQRLGVIDEVEEFSELERTDDLDRTYKAAHLRKPDISDDLDITYMVKHRKPDYGDNYGLVYAVKSRRKSNFREPHVTFSTEPIQKKYRGSPRTHNLEPISRRRLLLPIVANACEPSESPEVVRISKPFELEPVETRNTSRGYGITCAVESIERPTLQRHVQMYPCLSEDATRPRHSRPYDLVGRVVQEWNVAKPRRPLHGVGPYRVVGIDSDSNGVDLPDELETIDTPQITELDSQYDGSHDTLGKVDSTDSVNRSQDVLPDERWERVSIQGTLEGSQGTFNTEVDRYHGAVFHRGSVKPGGLPDQRWERVSIQGTLEGSQGTLYTEMNRDNGAVVRGSRKPRILGERWEPVSIPGTLAGSRGTFNTEASVDNGAVIRESNKHGGLAEQRWERVSIPGTLAGSHGTFRTEDDLRYTNEVRRSRKSDGPSERSDHGSIQGTLAGSRGTFNTEDQNNGGSGLRRGDSQSERWEHVSIRGAGKQESSADKRWERVSIQGTLAGSRGNFNTE